ncbi:hypothetical protein Tco_0626284 [Tanacetum coccineum]|uniref:Uncharacterized protein n=1 Tax=Tanacetum coccineum TaxID=301880 RepID=A0ABQ4WJ46_9ASTR
MEQYVVLNRGNQASSVVKPEIGGNVDFEIKSQFMRELREETFSENKNDNAHEHVERVLDIVSLFNIPGVSHDAVMRCDLHKRAFIQRYCPPSKTAKQLEEIRNFKQEGDETLYQAWERYNDQLYKCPTHDINSYQKADHSQKWHDGSSSRNIDSSSNSKWIAAIVNKLHSLGRDMKKLKENVHAIQIGCQTCEGDHLDKECPLNKEVKRYDQPSSGERRPSLTEIINKYMEEAAKRHAEQDEWLNKFYQNAETNREAHDKIIQDLETKVRTLINDFEGRANGEKFKECKAICTKDGSLLYTSFFYSLEEIEYFSANLRFSDNERQEIDKSGIAESLAALEATLEIKKVPLLGIRKVSVTSNNS